MHGASGSRDSAPRAGRRRRLRVQAAVLLLVLGWPVCGSEDSDSLKSEPAQAPAHRGHVRAGADVAEEQEELLGYSVKELGYEIGGDDDPEVRALMDVFSEEGRVAARAPDPGLDRRGAAGPTPGGAAEVMNVGALRPHERLLSLGQVSETDAKTQTPRASQRQPGRQRRGLQSSALRMLNDLARLFVPREATLPRVYAEFQSQRRGAENMPGGWAETYICLLYRTHQNLRAERLRQESLERTEQGDAQRELSACQSHLSQIQETLIKATQDKIAIGPSLRALQRREEQWRGMSPESPSNSQAQEASAANVKRLQADRLRSETHVRGLQAQEKLARIRCGLMVWREAQAKKDAPLRRSKLLQGAEEHIDNLGLDASALVNISRNIQLNVTLPACSSRRQGPLSSIFSWTLRKLYGQEEDEALESAWVTLPALQRSFQQASSDIFFDLTEVTVECEQLQNQTHFDADALLHQASDLLTIKGDMMHLERTVATMQTELTALQTAHHEVKEQARRLQAAMDGAGLPQQQQQLCSAALVKLQEQSDSVAAQVRAKINEMAGPQIEIVRLRILLDESQESEVIARRTFTRDGLRHTRCSLDWNVLHTSAEIIARHSQVLTFLVNDYRLRGA